MWKLHKGISLGVLTDIREDREELLKNKKEWANDGNWEVRTIFLNEGAKGMERLKSARELADFLIVRCEGSLSNTEIGYYLYENPIVEYVDDFLLKVKMYIKDDILEKDKVLEIAKELAFDCDTLEEVKLGLSLLRLFNVEEYIDSIMTLGVYNEYSFYVSRLLVTTKKSNKYLFKLCKESSGTGKIHYLSCLEPMNEEIVDWIVAKGWDGEIYSKILWELVLIKIDLEEISSKETINKDRFSSLTSIITQIYLFYGFDNIQNFTSVIRNYLNYFDKYVDTFEEYIALKLIYKDLIDRRDEGISFSSMSLGKGGSGELEELYIKAQRIYLKVDWGKQLKEAIESDDDNSYLIFQIAIEMDDDLTIEETKRVLEKDPYEVVWYKYIEVLEDTAYSTMLLKIVEENIHLEKVISSPKNLKENQLTIEEKDHYCLLSCIESMTIDTARQNQDFLVAALSANMVETRIAVLDKLEVIKEDWEPWVYEEIEKVVDIEVNTIVQDKELAMIYEKSGSMLNKFNEITEYLEPQEDDLFLLDTIISSKVVKCFDKADIIFEEGKLVNLELDIEKDTIVVVSNFGVILGEIPKKDRSIIKNLLNGKEKLYGRISKAAEGLDFVYLKVFIRKEPLIVELSNALKEAFN